MASIQKHGDKWRVFVTKNGVTKTKVCRTKTEAKTWAEHTSVALAEADPEATSVRLHTAIDRYIKEVVPLHKGERWETLRLEKLKRELANKPLEELTKKDLSAWRDGRDVAPGTIRREMSLLNALLEHCRKDWGYVAKNPLADVKKPMAPPARRRGVTAGEIATVCEKLNYKDELPVVQKKQEVAVLFLLAIETAMRKGEMLSLTPERIHLSRRIVELEETKNGDRRQVPLSTRAVELLKKLPKGCFTVSSASADALFREARPVGLHFHDSRSEGITRLSKKLQVLDLARVIGHRDIKSLMWYYNETAEDIARRLD